MAASSRPIRVPGTTAVRSERWVKTGRLPLLISGSVGLLLGGAVRGRWPLGGSLGFALPALVSATLPDVTAALPIAGAIAGTVLGGFQAVALRSLLTRLGMRGWVLATAAGTALACVAVSVSCAPAAASARREDHRVRQPVPWPRWALTDNPIPGPTSLG
ncbi:hypothetical protein ACQPZ2_22245 [Nocardia pseudovaccinii]|uniref:hypothetical protein n=1 Tax=Nocardia pseudovaccinii TaxID=189540 RepID=UPI003D8B0C3D